MSRDVNNAQVRLTAEFFWFRKLLKKLQPSPKQQQTMGTLCQCFVRFCCDPDGHPERRRLQLFEAAAEPEPRMHRGNEESTVCAPGVRDLLHRLRDQWHRSEPFFDIMRQQQPLQDEEKLLFKKVTASPVHQATSFTSERDIPCIHSDEIVFPGSAIQRQMADQLKSAKLKDDDIECVVCMEAFDRENPRMPTLCGCGENKTFFHLPCLYQWIEQCEECPSCRTKLSWEEF